MAEWGSKYEVVTVSAQTTLTQLTGACITENAGTPAAAAVNIRNASSTGDIVARLKVGASGTLNVNFPNLRATAGNSFYVEVTAGTVQIGVYGN